MAHPKPGRMGPLPGSVTVSPLPAPRLTVREAAERLDAAGQLFTFFLDARTGRGSIVYHRYDGHYGLLVPAGVRHCPSAGPARGCGRAIRGTTRGRRG